MKCSFHSTVEAHDLCIICNQPLCRDCAHKIKNRTYCQDCLGQGAEWAAVIKHHKLPADAPRKAAWLALIPGMGAVYNNEYTKALTYFAVFAGLSVMGSRVHGIFGFGAFVFLIFTIFDAYRTAEANIRRRAQAGSPSATTGTQDKTGIGWGIFLIILGVIFLLHNLLPYYFLNRLWPLLFIALGVYLIYHALRDGERRGTDKAMSPAPTEQDSRIREDI